MSLSEICIKRPVFATVLSLVVVTLGAIFFSKLQIRGIPDIDPPIVTVSAVYPGADALYMEKEITTRIEKALKNVKNLDFMSSSSSTGETHITLSFKLSADIEIALNDVRSKISEISDIFPDDMPPPSVSKLDSDSFPSMWLTITSDTYDDMTLTRIVENNVQLILEKLPSVGQANIYGDRVYTMLIEPHPAKMQQFRISPVEIEAAVRAQNQDYPAGTIKTDFRNFTLRLKGTLSTPAEFENVIIKNDGSNIVKLRDIANISLAPAENDVVLRYNGTRSMAVGAVMQSKANVLDLSKEVRAELENIRKNLPAGIKIQVAYDGATSVDASIKAVFHTIIEALALVVLVTYLFLGSFKITIIPFVTIPVSLIGTFTAMYFMGFSINTFTLLAMILAIGLVVDDAIVMLENIFRHNELGEPPVQAATMAVKEISFAIVAMTITLASVFLPIGLIEGFVGKLFIEFAWTLAFCVLFSGFVALTLTPMMASRMMQKSHEPLTGILKKFDNYLKVVQVKYLHYLNLAIANKKKFLAICASSIVLLVFSFVFVNKDFVPAEDDGHLQVAFIGPEGSTVVQSEKSVMEAEAILATHPDIYGYFDVVGWGGSDSAFAFVPLKDWSLRKKSQDNIRDELNIKFSRIPGMSIFAMSPRSLASGGANKAIEFNLQTSLEYEQLDTLSQKFVDLLKANPAFLNVERDLKSSTPTLDIIVNRDKAYIYGVDFATIGTTVQYLISGKQIGDFRMGNDIYDVILRYDLKNRNNVSSVSNILIKSKNDILPLEVVAKIDEKITVKSYSHYNTSKSVTISSDLAPNHKITEAIDVINNVALKNLDLSNTKLEYVGEIKRMNESNSNIGVTFLFALVFIYLVLSAQFESFTDPLLILLAVPFSITGGIFALLITGNSINMYSNIGLVTLIGLVTKNSIMIVEFANQLRTQGLSVRDAITQSAHLRLRPILMTTLATIFGAVPLVLANGAGAASRNSIGLVIVGGMAVGTLFSVFVIPVLYENFKKDAVI